MMPSPFDFEVLLKNNYSSAEDYFSGKNCFSRDNTLCESVSVLDSRVPCGPTSSSTPSSSLGGGSSAGGGGAASPDMAAPAVVSDRNTSPKWQRYSPTGTCSSGGRETFAELLPVPPSLSDKCAMEGWESVLSESTAASPGQEQSNFRCVMGDVDDPTLGSLNKFVHFGGSAVPELDFNSGFGVMENLGANFFSNFTNSNRSSSEKIYSATNPAYPYPIKFLHNLQNPMLPSPVDNNFEAIPIHHSAAFSSLPEMKPLYSYGHEQAPSPPPQAKRLNSGGGQISRQELYQQQQLQFLPHYLHHRPKTSGVDELQQAIINELYKAAELLQAGNPSPAQGILARLNQHLSPTGSPFHRAAFYCKEAMQLLHHPSAAAHSSPLSLLFKIGAYKSFSEISPLIDFANFTSNQALLETVQGFDRIHIVDFDIGYGGQWASLMQELALRSNGAPLLKITALVSPSTYDQLELSLTRENLIHFANEINMSLELEITSIDSLSSSWSACLNEAVAVNIPASCLTSHQWSAPFVLGLVKRLSPRIVLSIERGCDRAADLPAADHIIHAMEAFSNLLESLDAVSMNANVDALQKIERWLIQPEVEKLVMSRFGGGQKWHHWRSLFMNYGFSPITFSSFAESQAEFVVKKMIVGGFEVEKKQSSLLLCWHGMELLSVSVWRCSNI